MPLRGFSKPDPRERPKEPKTREKDKVKEKATSDGDRTERKRDSLGKEQSGREKKMDVGQANADVMLAPVVHGRDVNKERDRVTMEKVLTTTREDKRGAADERVKHRRTPAAADLEADVDHSRKSSSRETEQPMLEEVTVSMHSNESHVSHSGHRRSAEMAAKTTDERG